MKKSQILRLFSTRGSLAGLVVLSGLMLNLAFTITPTKTEAVFGGQDNFDPLIQNQESGIAFINDSLGLEPLDANEEQDIPGITNDSALADGMSLFPGSPAAISGQSGAKTFLARTYGGVSRADYLPKGCEWGVKEGRFVAGAHSPHNAQDIAAPTGTPVIASCAGTVVFAQYSGYNGGYGLNIIIDHNGFKTRYGHLSDIAVTVGQSVVKGERIGKVGNTGRSSGAHLHFEVW